MRVLTRLEQVSHVLQGIAWADLEVAKDALYRFTRRDFLR